MRRSIPAVRMPYLPLCWLFLSLGILTGRPGALRAADVTTSQGTKDFLFGGTARKISKFDGGVGMRFYLRDGLAFRPEVDFGWSFSLIKPNELPHGHPVLTNETLNNTEVSLHLTLEKHLGAIRSVSPYVGGMLEGTYINNKTKPMFDRSLADQNTKVTYKETDGGALGVLGFEWAWTSSLTVGGEYRAGFEVITHKEEWEFNTEPDQLYHDTRQYSFGFRTAAAFVSIKI